MLDSLYGLDGEAFVRTKELSTQSFKPRAHMSALMSMVK